MFDSNGRIVIDIIFLLRCELARFPNYIFAYSKYHGQQFENKVRQADVVFTTLGIFGSLRNFLLLLWKLLSARTPSSICSFWKINFKYQYRTGTNHWYLCCIVIIVRMRSFSVQQLWTWYFDDYLDAVTLNTDLDLTWRNVHWNQIDIN